MAWWILINFLMGLAQASVPDSYCSQKLQMSAAALGKFKIGTKYHISPQNEGFVRNDGAEIRVKIENMGDKTCWRNYLCHHHYNYSLVSNYKLGRLPIGIYSPSCPEKKPKTKEIGPHSFVEEAITLSLGKGIKPGKYWIQVNFNGNPSKAQPADKEYRLTSVPLEIEIVD